MLNENVMPSNLKRLISDRRTNANRLAIAAGVPAPRLSDILNGKTTNPSIRTVLKLAVALNVSIDELVAEPVDHQDAI